jgi:nucleoside-triphosphatase
MSRTPRHILLTGRPGIGKTTLVRHLARRLGRLRPAGFYTEEIRGRNVRIGFRLVMLPASRRSRSDREFILSHVTYGGLHRVGRYGVDLAGFDRLLGEVDLPHSAGQLLMIDEIGKMECLSELFIKQMSAVLDSSKRVLATVALKGTGFIQQVKARTDAQVLTVTIRNRDELVQRIAEELRKPAGRH